MIRRKNKTDISNQSEIQILIERYHLDLKIIDLGAAYMLCELDLQLMGLKLFIYYDGTTLSEGHRNYGYLDITSYPFWSREKSGVITMSRYVITIINFISTMVISGVDIRSTEFRRSLKTHLAKIITEHKIYTVNSSLAAAFQSELGINILKEEDEVI